ncbi:MAG: potassium channel protein [Candidatus Aminicenantes bacterium]|nr:potassium channel protein [Candidatus Aminicenantes bacterium]
MWKPVALIILVILFGTTGYYIIEHMNFLEALYMTVITIFTVGFKEVKGPLSPIGQIFTILIILGGAGTAVFSFTKFGEIVFEGGIDRFFRRKRMERQLETIKDHYIVCGYGRLGKIVVEQLQDENNHFVVIDIDEEKISRLRQSMDCLSIHGDASIEDILIKAGIKRAKGLAALLPSDADNLYLVLSVRLLNPSIFILSKALDDEGEKKILQIGANRVVSPYKVGGLKIAQGLVRPTLVDFMDIIIRRKELSLAIEEFIVAKHAQMADKTLRECDVRKKANVMVIAIKKPGKDIVFNPSPDMKIDLGDTLLVLGDKDQIGFFEDFCLGDSS